MMVGHTRGCAPFVEESAAFGVRLHEDRAFSVQLTRPYALEASFHVRSLRSSRRVRVASRMTQLTLIGQGRDVRLEVRNALQNGH